MFCDGSSAKRSFKPLDNVNDKRVRGYRFPLREMVMDVSSGGTFNFL